MTAKKRTPARRDYRESEIPASRGISEAAKRVAAEKVQTLLQQGQGKDDSPDSKILAEGAKNFCGYCGSTKPMVSPEEMYGPGATGWDCCPDCGGV